MAGAWVQDNVYPALVMPARGTIGYPSILTNLKRDLYPMRPPNTGPGAMSKITSPIG